MPFSRRLVAFVSAVLLSVPGPAQAFAQGAMADPVPGRLTPVGVWPLRPVPEVVAGFDPPDSPWGAGHRGVDLLGAVDQRVRSALPGRVSFAGRLAGRGVVVVDHGDTRTTYEPVSADVTVGSSVGAGDPIGRLELAGSHCFPRACLHWGWLRGETYLDPVLLVGAGPIRLLPLWRDEPVVSAAQPTTVELRALHPVSSVSPLPYSAWRPLLRLLHTRGYVG